MISREHAEQAAFIDWCRFSLAEHPELARIFAIPNGGARHKATAGRLKAEGVRAGVPDLMLPVARGGYHGLFMELKVAPNKPTPAQAEWLEWLDRQGYAARVCYGFDDLVETVEWYLNLKEANGG
jgi:hypothetical protein